VLAVLIAAAVCLGITIKGLWDDLMRYNLILPRERQEKHFSLITSLIILIAQCLLYFSNEVLLCLWLLIMYPSIIRMLVNVFQKRGVKQQAERLYQLSGLTILFIIALMLYRNFVK